MKITSALASLGLNLVRMKTVRLAAFGLAAVLACEVPLPMTTAMAAPPATINSAAQARIGKERVELAQQLEPLLANPAATGLMIFEVEAGSQAMRAGFRVGDILTHYDGQPVATTDDLITCARQFARNGKGKVFILGKRGAEELTAEFDAAPMGVRLVSVKEGEPKSLWRPATSYSPDYRGISQLFHDREYWEIVTQNGKPVGWNHCFATKDSQGGLFRMQSLWLTDNGQEKRDVLIRFAADPFLSPQLVRLASNESLIMEAARRGDELVGERIGGKISAPIYQDTVSSYLVPWLASTLPQQEGAGIRCSYLESNSHSAAPFADLVCLGEEAVPYGKQSITAFCYEQSVFGSPGIKTWIDPSRRVVRTEYSPGVVGTLVSVDLVEKLFPDAKKAFDPIDQIPTRKEASADVPKAN